MNTGLVALGAMWRRPRRNAHYRGRQSKSVSSYNKYELSTFLVPG